MPWFRWDTGDLILRVKVQPRAQRDEIAGVIGDHLKVCIAAPPVEGRANARLIAFLGKQFGVAKGRATVLRGEKARTKLIRIQAPTKIPPGLDIIKPG
ncbi:MAG: DUF167 family protein [Acidiferrobacterales bacterium]